MLAQDLNHAGGYEPTVPFNVAEIPIVIHSPAQADHVARSHAELSGSIALVVVQGFSQHLEKQTQITTDKLKDTKTQETRYIIKK